MCFKNKHGFLQCKVGEVNKTEGNGQISAKQVTQTQTWNLDP